MLDPSIAAHGHHASASASDTTGLATSASADSGNIGRQRVVLARYPASSMIDFRPRVELHGRRREREVLDQLIAGARAGQSGVLVLRGEPGIGKTALLEYLVQHASGCRIARVVGVQADMELAFAGVHQLCGPLLDRLDHLPGPQREAIGVAFGLAGALATAKILSAVLVGVLGQDPATLTGASLFLILVAALACYFPARRAVRIEPAAALRED